MSRIGAKGGKASAGTPKAKERAEKAAKALWDKRYGAGRPPGTPRKLMHFSLSMTAVQIVTQFPRGERSGFVDKAILNTQKHTP